jgi:flagellar biosynthesis anti-sigma factor FlgM
MGGIHGIGGVPEAVNLTSANGRSRRPENRQAAAPSNDSVQLSSKGSNLARLSGLQSEIDEARAARIEEARENIENGTYRILEVVEVVAGRVSKYIADE